MTRRGMMGLELVVPVEHFDDNNCADSEEYRSRYPNKINDDKQTN